MKKKLFADVVGTTRIDIPELEIWIECRNELSVGEERRSFGQAIRGQVKTEEGKTRTEFDMARVSFNLCLAYITDWSVRDDNDKSVPYSEAALSALTGEAYKLIEDAVDKHVEAAKGKAKTPTASGADRTSASAA